jgi:protein DGCR14
MPPPSIPPTKRIKRPPKVLSEETYESTLSHIIARDFYPGLLETEVQQEYMDAIESKDGDWIKDASRKLEAAMTPRADGKSRGRRGVSVAATPIVGQGVAGGETPRGWETPMSTPGRSRAENQPLNAEAEKERKEDEARRNMSLAAFQAKYTSEDNESFNKLLDKQNEKRAQKYGWLWDGNQLPSNQRIAQAKVLAERRLQGKDDDHKIGISEEASTRKALPDTAPCPPRNALMFVPDGVDDENPPPSATTESNRKKPPKAISFPNTRLPNPDAPSSSSASNPRASRASSPSQSEIASAIAGHVRATASETGIPAGSETPRVNGYAFVDADPTAAEEALATHGSTAPDAAEAGANASAIFARLTADAASDGASTFAIREASRREQLHHRMLDRSAALKRGEGAGRGVTTPETPRFASFGKTPVAAARSAGKQPSGNLTPAAQRLLDRVGGTPARKQGSRTPGAGAGGFGSVEKKREWWTPNATPRSKGR